jgi:CheY-like chemotaxis protein
MLMDEQWTREGSRAASAVDAGGAVSVDREVTTPLVDKVDVLVVDDDAPFRSSVSALLQRWGYSAGEACDGEDALSILGSLKVGVLLLDLNMPRLDGWGLLDALDNPPPVLVLTAREWKNEADKRRDKIFAIPEKPLPPEKLRAAMSRAIARSRLSDH